MGSESTTETAAVTADLQYPSEDWVGFARNHLGPSLLWALVGIGGSHVVLAPTLGGLYGVFAVWIVTIVYLLARRESRRLRRE